MAVGCLLLTALAQLAGVRAVPVLSGSMRPYAPQGSLVLTTPVRPADVRVGDVLAFVPPAPFDTSGHPVMHRVHTLTTVDGTPAMTTQGDANPGPDPWTIALTGADLGRATAVVPLVGWALMAGPGALVLVLVGTFAVAEAVHLLRGRPRCGCTDRAAGAGERAPEPAAEPITGAEPPPTAPGGVVELPATTAHPHPRDPLALLPSPRRPTRSEVAAPATPGADTR